MIDNHFRDILPRFTPKLIALYQRFGLTPNHITLLGLPIAAVSALCVALEWNILAIAIWWLGRLFDGTDGIYARETNQTSAFGAYLDIVCDMAAYGLMLFGFYLAHPDLDWAFKFTMFMYVLCITSALALGLQEQIVGADARDNRGLRLGAGLAEAGETGIAYTLFLLFPGSVWWLIWVWNIILVVTVVSRTMLAKRFPCIVAF